MKPLEARFIETLQANGARATAPRRAIFAALQTADEPLSLQQVVARTPGADRASIYRGLALFGQLHIVNVVPMGWKKRFELAEPYTSHHHHIYCERCGNVISMESPALEKLIRAVADEKGFLLHRHTLELSGLCAKCQEAKTPEQQS